MKGRLPSLFSTCAPFLVVVVLVCLGLSSRVRVEPVINLEEGDLELKE